MSLHEDLMQLQHGDEVTATFISKEGNGRLVLSGKVFVSKYCGDICLTFDDEIEFWLFTQMAGDHPQLQSISAWVKEVSATCGVCKRERTSEDKDYNPIQAITGQPCGWYSADDGEICGRDMDVTLGRK